MVEMVKVMTVMVVMVMEMVGWGKGGVGSGNGGGGSGNGVRKVGASCDDEDFGDKENRLTEPSLTTSSKNFYTKNQIRLFPL